MLGHFVGHLGHFVGHFGSLGHDCNKEVETIALGQKSASNYSYGLPNFAQISGTSIIDTASPSRSLHNLGEEPQLFTLLAREPHVCTIFGNLTYTDVINMDQYEQRLFGTFTLPSTATPSL